MNVLSLEIPYVSAIFVCMRIHQKMNTDCTLPDSEVGTFYGPAALLTKIIYSTGFVHYRAWRIVVSFLAENVQWLLRMKHYLIKWDSSVVEDADLVSIVGL